MEELAIDTPTVHIKSGGTTNIHLCEFMEEDVVSQPMSMGTHGRSHKWCHNSGCIVNVGMNDKISSLRIASGEYCH